MKKRTIQQESLILTTERLIDKEGTEEIRMVKKPSGVLLEEKPMAEKGDGEGYIWKPLYSGGILKINRINGYRVQVLY